MLATIRRKGTPVKIVCIILSIYYLVTRYTNYHSLHDHIAGFSFNINSLVFLLYLFYLPVAIVTCLTNKIAGWVLISVFLVFNSVMSISELVSEIISPREIYNHPDSWTHTTRTEIYFIVIAPLVFWLVLLWFTQTKKVLTFYMIEEKQRKQIFLFTIAGALLFKIFTRLWFS